MGDQGKPHPLTQAPPDNNSKKGLLACGCDPKPLGKEAVRGRTSPNMFGPGHGFFIQQCAQCKEILDFGLVRSETKQPLITMPTGLM